MTVNEKLISYIKWLLDLNDSLVTDTVDKETVKIMLLSIIGEMMTGEYDEPTQTTS